MERRQFGGFHQCRSDIISELVEYDGVLETLYLSGVINERRYEQIKSKTNRFDAVALILQCIEQTGEEGVRVFCAAITDDYPWLVDKLFAPEKKSDIKTDLQLPDSWLQSVPSERELLTLSKEISAEDWELLALELGLTLAEVERAKQPDSDVMKAFTMLVLWQRKKGNDGYREKICHAMKQCDMGHIVQGWKP